MAKPKKPIIVGQEYGYLTVLAPAEKDKTGHICWKVRCRCGNEFVATTGRLSAVTCRCKKCYVKYPRKVLSYIGNTINGFKILSIHGKNKAGAVLYKCKCLKCGSIIIRTRGDLTARKGRGCIYCRPEYHFNINGKEANGMLPDGTKFVIDSCLVGEFCKYHWFRNKKGYIERRNRGLPKMMLHWFALGEDANHEFLIDHINRDKTDCRRKNLRRVTPLQNSMNHSKLSSNKSGYTGVFWNKRKNLWVSTIVINGRHIYLGYLKSKVEAAQRYNYACLLTRGEYAGELNDVPEPSWETKRIVIEKLKRHLGFAALHEIIVIKEAS